MGVKRLHFICLILLCLLPHVVGAMDRSCALYLILSSRVVRLEEGQDVRVMGRTGSGKHGTIAISVKGRLQYFKPESGESTEIVERVLRPGVPGQTVDREIASSRFFARVEWRRSPRVRRAEIKMSDGRTHKGVLVEEVPGKSLSDIFQENRAEYNRIIRSPEFKQAAEEATLMQFITGNFDWISYEDLKGIDIAAENVIVHLGPDKKIEVYFIDSGLSFPSRGAIAKSKVPFQNLGLPDRLKRYEELRAYWKGIQRIFYPLVDLEDMSEQTKQLLYRISSIPDKEFLALLSKNPTVLEEDIYGMITRIRYLEERFLDRNLELQLAKSDYPADINVRDHDDVTSGRAQREAVEELKLGDADSNKSRLPVETDLTNDPHVVVEGPVQRVDGRNKNVVYQVKVGGEVYYFKPKSGESERIGGGFLGDFKKGMMADREVFASHVYRAADWFEAPEAKMVRVTIDGKVEEGALIRGLNGKTIREFGQQKFDNDIEPLRDYRQSRERALAISIVTGNEDWYRVKPRSLPRENPGNVLIEIDPEDPSFYNFYWIDGGLSLPKRGRINRTKLSGPESAKYLERNFDQLWPLIARLERIDLGTIHLIKQLNDVSFQEWKRWAKGLPTITDGDIQGMMVRIHYLYKRFVEKDPEYQVEDSVRAKLAEKTAARTNDNDAHSSQSTRGAFDQESTRSAAQPNESDRSTRDNRHTTGNK